MIRKRIDIESINIENRNKYLLSRNLYYQEKSNKHMFRLTKNIEIMKPNWSFYFIDKYIMSRYPDYFFYDKKLKSQYIILSCLFRERFRLNLICKEKFMCEDIINYIHLFL